MDEILRQIGLNQKDSELYLYLLQHGPQTTMQLAEVTDEKRTNIYMILDNLVQKSLVAVDTSKTPRSYRVLDPANLQNLVSAEQERQQQTAAALLKALPRLKSTYALMTDKPGVVHLAGIEGFKSVLDDMARAQSDILLVASNEIVTQPEVYALLLSSLQERMANQVQTRAIFELANLKTIDTAEFAQRNFEVRFLGNDSFPGEVTVYDNSVLLTTYRPTLVNTVITSVDIARTMRLVLEELWSKAQPAC